MNENFPSSRTPRLRRLSAEEIELWLNVTRGVARRPWSGSPQLPQPRNDAELQASEAGNNLPKGASAATPPSPVERKAPPPLAPLERRLRQKLARGRAAPDAAIDLHGMRRQEAFAALREFLARAQIGGARLVLVVTGKGDRAASGEARQVFCAKACQIGCAARNIVRSSSVSRKPRARTAARAHSMYGSGGAIAPRTESDRLDPSKTSFRNVAAPSIGDLDPWRNRLSPPCRKTFAASATALSSASRIFPTTKHSTR